MIPQPTGHFDADAGQWVATLDWCADLSNGCALIVLAGFASDGASIPRLLWPFVGPRYAPRTFPAALAHDALYASELLPRRACDDEFRRLLILTGVGRGKARAYWCGVRAFGWAVWMRHTLTSVTAARLLVDVVQPVTLRSAAP